ncbi:hypothetical protein BS47DRAFT_1488802 [Hydnum rufescens UP504]|uniref:C2H2-type domain-containing protein n=1 Tax=Hydnum rufescens UP504 TaxID=1448309 RepID=A0A9P6AKF3_9AGAM|nr:hypothetical protein BS47DRAFT_1488802 [Hydnum rufescens UP504]
MHEELQAQISQAYASQEHVPQSDDPIISTIQIILNHARNDARVLAALSNAFVSDTYSVYNSLVDSLSSGKIDTSYAHALSSALLSLADGNTLDEVEPYRGKRKREESDHPHRVPPPPPGSDIDVRIRDAVDAVSHVLDMNRGVSLNEGIVGSIHSPLHRISLFASTYAGSGSVPVLYELFGLIHVMGILHGYPINPTSSAPDTDSVIDISTTVYPCKSCPKVFSHLYDLNFHDSSRHTSSRPHRCNICSFTCAHDFYLSKHSKVHESPQGQLQYQCRGCKKRFLRRDSVRRHQSDPRSAPGCLDVIIRVIDQTQIGVPPGGGMDEEEEGEIDPGALAEAQAAVLRLHARLYDALALGPGHERIRGGAALRALVSKNSVAGGNLGPARIPPLAAYGLNEDRTRELARIVMETSEAARTRAEEEAKQEASTYHDTPRSEGSP